jgi:hypothetical protein
VFVLVIDTRTHLRVRSFVDERGHLFLYGPDDLPGNVPADDYTGDRLDVSNAVRVGSVGTPALATTRCDGVAGGSPATCRALWIGASDMLAPADGGLRCTETGKFEFDTDSGMRLFFAANQYTSSYCDPGQLVPAKGGAPVLPDGQYSISAQDSRGHALSVAVSADGTLYAGDIAPVDGCPCLGGT